MNTHQPRGATGRVQVHRFTSAACLGLAVALQSMALNASSFVDGVFYLLTNSVPIIQLEYSCHQDNSKDTIAFIAGRQPNTFFFAEASLSANGTLIPKDRIFGRSYEHYWAIGANIVKATSIDQTGKADESESLREGVEAHLEQIDAAMTFGVTHLSGPARQTAPLRFEGVSTKFGAIDGVVSESHDDVSVEYRVSLQTNRVYHVRYPKANFSPEGFPREALRSVIQGGKSYPLGRCRYSLLVVGNTNLGATGGFVPSMFLETDKPKELFLINSDRIYTVKGGDSLVEMPKPGVSSSLPLGRSSHGFLLFCVIFVSLNLLLVIWLMFRANPKDGMQHLARTKQD